jgi:hypothetical protein
MSIRLPMKTWIDAHIARREGIERAEVCRLELFECDIANVDIKYAAELNVDIIECAVPAHDRMDEHITMQ